MDASTSRGRMELKGLPLTGRPRDTRMTAGLVTDAFNPAPLGLGVVRED